MSGDTTTTYRCPDEIARLFDVDPEAGRSKAVEWAASLDLKIGDRVWLPEIGWNEFTGAMNRLRETFS